MMNDMMPTIEETLTPDIAAEIEHREWERGNEERERWEALEAVHGPLLTKIDLDNYHKDMEEIYAKSHQLDLDLENAFKCDDDDDEGDWIQDFIEEEGFTPIGEDQYECAGGHVWHIDEIYDLWHQEKC